MTPKMVIFGSLFGPCLGGKKALPEVIFGTPKSVILDPFWVTFWTPYLVVHAGYAPYDSPNIQVPPKRGQKGGPKSDPKRSKNDRFWSLFGPFLSTS